MNQTILALSLLAAMPLLAADAASGPALPQKLVPNWAQLPADWNFGECTGVEVDADDNVWVFNRGPHPVIQFDKTGKMLNAWKEVPVTSAHGLGIGPDGNIWLIDVKGHAVMKFNKAGRLLMMITNAGKQPGNNDTPYAFNEPTGIAFSPNGDFYVSDGYVNSRVVKFNKDGEYIRHWGSKGQGDGQFNLVHDVVLDQQGHVYVADRTNERIQIFDGSGKFLNKWTHAGAPWGLAYSAKESALYMSDGKNNRVVKLNLNGEILGTLGSFGKTPGRLDFAHHIAVDSEGSIYVVEIKNWRVQKFAK
ncbi:MAG: 6-bladed beta-propeller [Acidobacteriia bacterium]|nr:6-bladed beta-propeller [Terriglobia bacterium]